MLENCKRKNHTRKKKHFSQTIFQCINFENAEEEKRYRLRLLLLFFYRFMDMATSANTIVHSNITTFLIDITSMYDLYDSLTYAPATPCVLFPCDLKKVIEI